MTNVYSEGKFATRYCLVGVLRKYMAVAGIDDRSNVPLCRPLLCHRFSAAYTRRAASMKQF